MVKVPEYWIVQKERQWLMTTLQEDLSRPKAHIWSINVYDAARYERIRDAKRMAREVGGVVFRFVPATGKTERETFPIPEGACCDTCLCYRPYDGMCICSKSEYYRTNVSCRDVCEDWREKDGREGQTHSTVDTGTGVVEGPSAGSGEPGVL